jgi:hypothetical protein
MQRRANSTSESADTKGVMLGDAVLAVREWMLQRVLLD